MEDYIQLHAYLLQIYGQYFEEYKQAQENNEDTNKKLALESMREIKNEIELVELGLQIKMAEEQRKVSDIIVPKSKLELV